MFSFAEAIKKSAITAIEQCWPVRSTNADAETIKELISTVAELKQCTDDIHSTKILKEKLAFTSEEEEFCFLFLTNPSKKYTLFGVYSLRLGQIPHVTKELREKFFHA